MSSILTGMSLASGLGLTLFKLLISPLTLDTPIVGLESRMDYMGGFPLRYYERIVFFLPLVHPATMAFFTTTNFVIDDSL